MSGIESLTSRAWVACEQLTEDVDHRAGMVALCLQHPDMPEVVRDALKYHMIAAAAIRNVLPGESARMVEQMVFSSLRTIIGRLLN